MKTVTVRLTEAQARSLTYWLSYDYGAVQNNAYPRNEVDNAFTERIRRKILKALEQLTS